MTMVEKEPDGSKKDDDAPIWGARNFAPVIGRSERQTYHLLYSGALDGAVRKVGNQWVGSRRKLRALVLGEDA